MYDRTFLIFDILMFFYKTVYFELMTVYFRLFENSFLQKMEHQKYLTLKLQWNDHVLSLFQDHWFKATFEEPLLKTVYFLPCY